VCETSRNSGTRAMGRIVDSPPPQKTSGTRAPPLERGKSQVASPWLPVSITSPYLLQPASIHSLCGDILAISLSWNDGVLVMSYFVILRSSTK